MKVTLIDNNGEFVLDIPMSVSEITFRDFISFTASEQEYFKALEVNEVETKKDRVSLLEKTKDSYIHLLEGCSYLVKGDISRLPNISSNSVQQLIDNGYTLTYDALNKEFGLLELYAHFINLINSFNPEKCLEDSFVIDWKGRTYQIHKDESARTLLDIPLTAGEVVTAMEFQRRAIEVEKRKGDSEGNMAFALGMREMAVLCRRENEVLPYRKKELSEFIIRRAKIFEDLPMDIVLSVRFFLLNGLITYQKIHYANIFSIP